MSLLPKNVEQLIDELSKLPGIGPKMAQRLTFYLLKNDASENRALGEVIAGLKEGIRICEVCANWAEQSPCALCSDPSRTREAICVVEDPLDVMAIERTGRFKGLYHVLHGAISPLDGVGPEQLKITELIERLKSGEVKEIILATNPVIEGEATAMYLAKLITPLGIAVTRLAHGLPMGGDLEYADEYTLSQALLGRREYNSVRDEP